MTVKIAEDWTALYLPATYGEPKPTKAGFATEDAAYAFIFGYMCLDCAEERERALALSEEERKTAHDSAYPACASEWIVVKTADLDKASSFDEIMGAAGFEQVYPKEDRDDGQVDPLAGSLE